MSSADRYDVIVCGAGTAGCVVAARLAEHPDVRVLLLEAGGSDLVPEVTDSRRWMENIDSSRDWRFRAVPSPALNGRALPFPMGKVLGGGSSINGLVWARGHRSDFDEWAATTGDDRWSYESVLRTYRRIEDWQGPPDDRYRGVGGPVAVGLPSDPAPVASALVAAAASVAGVPAVADLNAAAMEGPGAAGIANVTVRDGSTRVSMVTSYLRPMLERPNLTVRLGAHVTGLRWTGDRVTGVDFVADGLGEHAVATIEVVLALGAVHTPKVLMQSGIGDEAALREHGIAVRRHLPEVGRNLQDHVLLAGCIWEYRVPEAPRNNSAEFTFFCPSTPTLAVPDLQPILEERPFASDAVAARYDVPAALDAAWTLAPGLVRPASRGTVSLTGPRSADPVRIDSNLLAERADVDALIACVELCREIGNSPELRPFVAREVMPGALSGRELERFVRDAAGTYFHLSGTTRMGRAGSSVVDGALAVHGTDGLRVADSSVMPTITTGNTMAPCVVIGELAADAIREQHGM